MPAAVQRTHSLPKQLQKVRCSEPVEAKTSARTKKSVRFSSHVAVQEVEHVLDMSKEDIDYTWYSKEECKAIKQTVKSLIHLMVEHRVEKEECTRGLDHRVPEKAQLRKQKKFDAFQVVWDTQEEQFLSGNHDDEAIAIIYQMETYKSREAALTWGKYDEKEAKEITKKSFSFKKMLKR